MPLIRGGWVLPKLARFFAMGDCKVSSVPIAAERRGLAHPLLDSRMRTVLPRATVKTRMRSRSALERNRYRGYERCATSRARSAEWGGHGRARRRCSPGRRCSRHRRRSAQAPARPLPTRPLHLQLALVRLGNLCGVRHCQCSKTCAALSLASCVTLYQSRQLI